MNANYYFFDFSFLLAEAIVSPVHSQISSMQSRSLKLLRCSAVNTELYFYLCVPVSPYCLLQFMSHAA